MAKTLSVPFVVDVVDAALCQTRDDAAAVAPGSGRAEGGGRGKRGWCIHLQANLLAAAFETCFQVLATLSSSIGLHFKTGCTVSCTDLVAR